MSQSAELAELEVVIQAGLGDFIKVGNALMRVRDGELFKEVGYATFTDYVRGRWKFSRQQAYRLIEAADIAERVPIQNERQARELSKLQDELQAAAWNIVVATAPEGPLIPSAHVRDVVEAFSEIAATQTVTSMSAAITEEAYERHMRQKAHITQSVEQRTGERLHRIADVRTTLDDLPEQVLQAVLTRWQTCPGKQVRVFVYEIERLA